MKIAFVGTHNSGKTTTLWQVASEIKKRDIHSFNVVPETARFCPYAINRKASFESSIWIITEQMRLEAQMARYHEILLCDRSIYDNIAYAAFGHTTQPELAALMKIVCAWGTYKPYDTIIWFKSMKLKADGLRDMDVNYQKGIELQFANIFPTLLPPQTKLYTVVGSLKHRYLHVFDIVWKLIQNETS